MPWERAPKPKIALGGVRRRLFPRQKSYLPSECFRVLVLSTINRQGICLNPQEYSILLGNHCPPMVTATTMKAFHPLYVLSLRTGLIRQQTDCGNEIKPT